MISRAKRQTVSVCSDKSTGTKIFFILLLVLVIAKLRKVNIFSLLFFPNALKTYI
jgi:hypothetical protein